MINIEMYAVKNLGDDLFLKVLSEYFSSEDFLVKTGLRYNKKHYQKNVHFDYSIINRISRHFLRRDLLLRKKAINANIILGGSMFIENGDALREQRGSYKNLFIIGSNFGPFSHDSYLGEYKKIFANAKDVCFREKYSAKLFEELGNIRVAPDVVFGLDTTRFKIESKRKIIISVIDLSRRDKLARFKDAYESKIAEIADYYSANGYEVVLMSFCKVEGDENAVKSIISKTKNKISAFFYDGNIDKALNEISSSELVIGTRFHSVVLGFVFNKRVLPVIYSNKTVNMLDDLKYSGEFIGIEDISSIDNYNLDNMFGCLENLDNIKDESRNHFYVLEKFLKGKK